MSAEQLHIPVPYLYLIYASPQFPKFDDVVITQRLQSFPDIAENGEIKSEWHSDGTAPHWGQITFGKHQIRVNGLPNPLPTDITDRTVHPSRWQPQIKTAMRHHQSHLSLVYTGEHIDPVEKMIALYQAAYAFEDENLVGIINPEAWVAHPPADFLTPSLVKTYREQFPFTLWVGYVKYFVDKQHFWLVTRGHHIFDVPDLASFIQPGDTIETITRDFSNVFYYIYEEDVFVTAGDTLSIGETGEKLAFTEIGEEDTFLMGPSGTLVINKIQSED